MGTRPMTEDEVRDMLKEAIEKAGSQLAFSLERDVDHSCLTPILRGRKPPTPQVLAALGLRKVVSYEKK